MAEAKKAKKGKPVQDELTVALMPETDDRVARYGAIGLVVALICGLWFATVELVVDEIMFDEEGQEEPTATMKIEE
ncbi:MAG: hypothetical protein J6V65_03515, partial [Fibrobacterales bacterium]|nr:hypothetical protein [Fibrobacterales bacterium]